MHGTLIMKENVGLIHSFVRNAGACRHLLLSGLHQSLRLVSSEQALKELGLNEHQLRFTCRVHLQDPHSDNDTLHRIYTHLKRYYWEGYTHKEYWDREGKSAGVTG